MALEDIPINGKIPKALTGAIGIVWTIDWLESVTIQKYKLVFMMFLILLLFLEVKNK